MRKGAAPNGYASYDQAKPDLLSVLGEQCSYCEAGKAPQDLHVEHIYPKDPHPELALEWDNFLVACNTCNSYKNIHLGNRRRRNLEARYIWPHLENTFRAFEYFADGRVELRPRLRKLIKKAAENTRTMVGLMLSPAKAHAYMKRGIAYDGIDKRREQWSQAIDFLAMYLNNPTPDSATTIAAAAARMGYFSIWMKVFEGHPEIRHELIQAFKADRLCFDANTNPRKKGRV